MASARSRPGPRGRECDDALDGLAEVGHDMVGWIAERLGIATVEEDRRAPGRSSCADVSPAVAHHEARRQVDVPVTCRLEQHPGVGLVTGALVWAGAHAYVVDGHFGP